MDNFVKLTFYKKATQSKYAHFMSLVYILLALTCRVISEYTLSLQRAVHKQSCVTTGYVYTTNT